MKDLSQKLINTFFVCIFIKILNLCLLLLTIFFSFTIFCLLLCIFLLIFIILVILVITDLLFTFLLNLDKIIFPLS